MGRDTTGVNAIRLDPNDYVIGFDAVVPDCHLLIVSDQGIGISSAEQAQLFQPFVRGALSQGQIGGTGLGLYIVRQIVEGHGGTIAVASMPGQGTSFIITLPLAHHAA